MSDGLQHFGAVDNLVTAGADGSDCSNPYAARQVGGTDVMDGQRWNVERHSATERTIRQKRTGSTPQGGLPCVEAPCSTIAFLLCRKAEEEGVEHTANAGCRSRKR
jgi:hypothetical protein